MAGYQNKVGGTTTRVTDSFLRGTLNPASGPPNWVQTVHGIIPLSNPYVIGGYTCDPVNGLNSTDIGQDNPLTSFQSTLQCAPLFPKVWGQSQYAQIAFKQVTGVISTGPAVMVNVAGVPTSTGGCYAILFVGGPATRLVRMNGGSSAWTETDLVAPIPGGSYVAGDVFRISYNVSTGLLTVTKNGVVLTTFTDLTLSGGVPGFTQSSLTHTAGIAPSLLMLSGDFGLGL